MHNWLIKYDWLTKLIIPFILTFTLSIFLCSYAPKVIYEGVSVNEGIILLLVGIFCTLLSILMVFLGFGLRTYYTATGVVRRFFSKDIKNYKWKDIASVCLVTKRHKDIFYFCAQKTPIEMLLLSKVKNDYIAAPADIDVQGLVVRFYRKPIRHFYVSLRRVQRAVPEGKQIVKRSALNFWRVMAFLLFALIFLSIMSYVYSYGALLLEGFIAIICATALVFGLLSAFLGSDVYTFFEQSFCKRMLFKRVVIHKFEVKSYGIYTHKNHNGMGKGRYVFISKQRLGTVETQYRMTHKNHDKYGFIAFKYDDIAYEALKEMLVFEPQKVARQFY